MMRGELGGAEWNRVSLAGRLMPGAAEVRGHGIRTGGLQPATFTIGLSLTPAQLEEFRSLMPVLQPRSAEGEIRAVSIEHPAVRLHGTHARVLEIGEPAATGLLGTFRIELHLELHRGGPR